MKIIVKKEYENKVPLIGDVYTSEQDFTLEKKSYKVFIRGIENPSEDRNAFYIEKILDIEKNQILKDKKIEKRIWRSFLKYLYFLDCELKKLKEKEIWFPPKIEVDDRYTTIPAILTNEEIDKIIENKAQRKKIYFSANLQLLEKFVILWEEKIKQNAKESEFRDIFFKNQELINLILGYSIEEEVKKENQLKEEKTNKTDLEGSNWIVEFKTPETKLFSKEPFRNNISGLSKELISSKIQLNLYIKKKNRVSKLSYSFNSGTLIIGHEKEIANDKNKILSLNLFNEFSNIRILLFSDITKIAKNLIKMFKSKRNLK